MPDAACRGLRGGARSEALVSLDTCLGVAEFRTHRNHLAREVSCLPGGFGTIVALGTESILLLAGDLVLVCDPLGGISHRPLFERAGQSIEGHVVLHRARAVLDPGSRMDEVGGEVHVLHASRDRGREVTTADRPCRLHHGFQAGPADLVHGDRGHRFGQARLECRLAGGILADAGLQNASHEDLVNRFRGDRGVLHRRGDRTGSQLGSWHPAQAAKKAADGGSSGGQDDGLVAVHEGPLGWLYGERDDTSDLVLDVATPGSRHR